MKRPPLLKAEQDPPAIQRHRPDHEVTVYRAEMGRRREFHCRLLWFGGLLYADLRVFNRTPSGPKPTVRGIQVPREMLPLLEAGVRALRYEADPR